MSNGKKRLSTLLEAAQYQRICDAAKKAGTTLCPYLAQLVDRVIDLYLIENVKREFLTSSNRSNGYFPVKCAQVWVADETFNKFQTAATIHQVPRTVLFYTLIVDATGILPDEKNRRKEPIPFSEINLGFKVNSYFKHPDSPFRSVSISDAFVRRNILGDNGKKNPGVVAELPDKGPCLISDRQAKMMGSAMQFSFKIDSYFKQQDSPSRSVSVTDDFIEKNVIKDHDLKGNTKRKPGVFAEIPERGPCLMSYPEAKMKGFAD